MKNLIINDNYQNPENYDIEIIERKGMGHPDTLADKLAEECSRVYSQYCLNNFGIILHHNFDKLYIGAGCFRYENNKIVMYEPVKVYVNGRASNRFNKHEINLEKLLIPVIKKYISCVLPRLNVEKELQIFVNCTQNTKIKNWFTPNSIDDVPDAKEIFANDTSLCVAHYPFSYCETLALQIEQMFWKYNSDLYPIPIFNDIGQDIKVMVSRVNNNITLTVCIPVYLDMISSSNSYESIIKKYESLIIKKAHSINGSDKYNIKVEVNRMANNEYLVYTLCKGSCIECGEEGVVGRGNNSQGLISAFRPHTVEAPCGKNERYHTGRVLSFLADRIVKRIYSECGIRCSLYCLTKNKNNLLNPFLLYLSVDKSGIINKTEISRIIEEELDENTYISKILQQHKLF